MRRVFGPRYWQLVAGLLAFVSIALAARQIKPGWNLFRPEQDVQLGREAAKEIEQQVEVVQDKRLTAYVARIGDRLAKASQAPDYPYTFKIVADKNINAFALPGGPIYVHSGLISAADNESQLAGVVAHEVAHVALRHSTNRASKAAAFQIPMVLAAQALGKKGGLLGSLGQIGIGFGVNSLFLKYSRKAEKDADIVGARMMARVGYDPVEMARFFEKLEGSGGGGRMPQFFSDHPNPGNRVRYVEEEVRELPKADYTKGETREFNRMKAIAARIEPQKKAPDSAQQSGAGKSSDEDFELRRYSGSGYRFSYPRGWKLYQAGDGVAVTVAPDNGLVELENGARAMARGMMAGYFTSRAGDLSRATDEIIEDLRASNAGLEPLRGRRRAVQFANRQGESTLLEGASPVEQQREVVWLLTTKGDKEFFYAIFVSPENEFNRLKPSYEKVLKSIAFE